MSRLIQLVVLSAILAVTHCQPLKLGGEIGGKSAIEIGGGLSARSKEEGGFLARVMGLFNWMGSVNGGATVDDHGIKGEVGGSVGGKIEKQLDVSPDGDAKLKVNKEGNAKVFAEINPYNAKYKASDENDVYATEGYYQKQSRERVGVKNFHYSEQ